jgi:hypothetical protein
VEESAMSNKKPEQTKERKLTEKERKRKEKFDALCTQMTEEGYTIKPMTLDVVKANILAFVVMLPFGILFAWLYFYINPTLDYGIAYDTLLILLLAYLVLTLVLTVVHELIHGLTWGIFTKNHFRSIEFGIIWKMLTPYCTCAEPLKKGQYLLGSVMPTLILGFGLGVVAAVCHSILLFIAAETMIFGGGGDFQIIFKMLFYRSKGSETVFYDHPTECGFVVFEK